MSRGLILGEDCGRLYSMFSGLAHNDPGGLKQRLAIAESDLTAAVKRSPEEVLEGYPGTEGGTQGPRAPYRLSYRYHPAEEPWKGVTRCRNVGSGRHRSRSSDAALHMCPSSAAGSKLRQDKFLKRAVQEPITSRSADLRRTTHCSLAVVL